MLQGLRRIAKGESNIDIVGRTKLWALVSSVVLLVSTLGLVFRGINLGLEFEGGTALTVPLKTDARVPEIEAALAGFEIGEPDVQISTSQATGDREVRVRSEHIEEPETLAGVQEALAKAAGQTGAGGQPIVDAVSVTDVGPSWGRQVSSKALRGLIVFLILVAIYISLRFEPKMAVAALAALFHDLLATAGIYALVGFEVTPATVIALLTLMGFSLYDTVVVFDKIRENAEGLTGGSRATYADMVNRSVNTVMMRSINTSLTSVLPVAGLLFVGVFLLGAETLKDLALAMFVGALVSTYSSIFVASPVLSWWKEREPRYRQMRARLEVGGRGAPEPAVAAAAPGAVGAAETPGRPAVRPAVRPPPRARRRRRGKRRR